MGENENFAEYKLLIMDKLKTIDDKLTCLNEKFDNKFEKYDNRIAQIEQDMAIIKTKAAGIGVIAGVICTIIVNLVIKYL